MEKMSQQGKQDFSSWRAFLWPVHGFELKKLIPMLCIFFLISLNYNTLRTLKDSLIVTAKDSGAEVIPFIKVWVMFPGAVGITWLYSYLSSRFSRERVFYIILSFFLAFFTLFALLYPYKDLFHPHETADYLTTILPEGCKGFIAMYRYWLFTGFYVMSELWGTTILFVLFWGFANHITRLSEAKRFYGLFGIGANFSGIVAGWVSVYLLRHEFNPSLPFGLDAWEQSLYMIIGMILVSGIMTIGVFRWLNKVVLKDPRFYDSSMEKKEKAGRKKVSLKDNFKYLLGSKYLLCIAAIVVAYNVIINLVEVLWKHEVRALYPDPAEYSIYMNQVGAIIGVVATLCALIVSGNAIRKFGWTFTAMITPMILLLTSICFFFFFFADQFDSAGFLHIFGMTPLTLVVFFGTLQNCLSRGAKYTVFDATKEIAFVPLSAECKINGKAAIDGVCSRMGKSGGAFIHQSLLLFFSTLSASAPYVACALFVVIGVWCLAVKALGKQFNALAEPAPETHPEEEPLPQEQAASA